ncbi:MAG: alpha/beta fold hydrolase [Candidatus Limnocylindria bacterium]
MSTQPIETRTVSTPDGRSLMIELGGDPAGVAILAHNGTPNTRHLREPWLEDAAQHGIRLISYDRPGYGGSTPQPGRTVADCAADVRAIADALEIERLAVWGASGGGPHALACAALLPDRVVAVAALCSIAPYGAAGLDYFAGMGQDNVDDIKLYLRDPGAARVKSVQDRLDMLSLTADQLTEGWESLLSPVDAAAVSGDLAAWLIRGFQDGLATTDEGWWEDGVAHLEPWGFALDLISIPAQVWHGRHDQFVPVQHGEWLAAHVPGAEAHISDTDGHLTLFGRIPDVHRWLTSRFD